MREKQRRSVEYVVVAGILVVVTTLLGVAVTGLLSLGADSSLVAAAKNVIPDSRHGQSVFLALALGVAAILAARVVAFAGVRRPGRVPGDALMRTEREAFLVLAAKRLKKVCWAVVIAIGVIAVVSFGLAAAGIPWAACS